MKSFIQSETLFFLLIISVSICIILIIKYWKKLNLIKIEKQKISKKSSEIIDLKDKLKHAKKTHDLLLKEIHHRVKNNLQVITSLLSLQASFINDDEIKKVFRYSQYRINSMAMVHEMLYESEDLSKIKINEYVSLLTSNLVKSMKGTHNNIKLNIDIPELHLNIDTVIPLGLLINEVITNSLKYGDNNNNYDIYVIMEHLKENNFVLYIGDNGQGFINETEFRSSNSLGLMLIHNLTIQLKGTIEKDNNKSGTNYIITFKENLTSYKNYENTYY